MERLTFEKIILLALGIIAVFAVLLYSGPAYAKLKTTLFGNDSSLDVASKPTRGTGVVFYDSFVEDYKTCKLSSDVECYCPIRNTEIASGYVIELVNQNKKTLIHLHANAEIAGGLLNDYSISRADESEGLKTRTEIIDQDLIFLSRDQFIKDKKLLELGFVPAERIFLAGSEIYTTDDLPFRNMLGFTNTILYKKDNEKTFFTNSVNGLLRCSSFPDVAKAVNNFDSMASYFKSCSVPKDKDVKCSSVDLNIPKDYSLKLEAGKLTISYKDKAVKVYNKFNINCILDSYFNPSRESSIQAQIINFNEYSAVDFYYYKKDNAVCIAVKT
ncbi:MAG TPA: hypothetical protein VJG30_02970 [Candidatus Nanoarchaeia archaeon]|nr:hypothetical protein [Candidatus Nanoarchaeia archaeon]